MMENTFALAFRANPVMMLIYSVESGAIIEANESFADKCGSTAQELAGKCLSDLDIWTTPDIPEELTQRIVREGKVSEIKTVCQSPNGVSWPVRICANSMISSTGTCAVVTFEEVKAVQNTDDPMQKNAKYFHSLIGAVPEIIHITDRRQKAKAPEDFEIKYHRLHESMMDAFAAVDMQGRIIEYNESYRKLLGYEQDELLSLTYDDITPEKWHAAEAEIIKKQVLARGFSDIYEKEFRRKDGTIIPVEMRTVLLRDAAGQPNCMWGIVRDLSQYKRVEAALRESEERFHMLVENAPEAIFVYDVDLARYIDANENAERLFGCSRKKLLESGPMAFFSQKQPDNRPVEESIAEHCVRALAGETVVAERSIHTAGGKDIICEVRLAPFPSPGRRLLRGTYIDITEQKKEEAALHEGERRLATLMANLPCIAYRCQNDPSRTMEFLSEGCLELTGYPAENIIFNTRMAYNDIIHPEDRDVVRTEVQAAIQENRPFRLIYRIHTAREEMRWVLEKGRGIYDQQGAFQALEGFITDVTEQKRAEAALRESEERLKLKLDSILLPDVNISDQELSNMLDTPAIQTLMDRVYELTNMAIAVLDVKGKILVASGWQDICTQFHRVHPETCRSCIESDLFLSNNLLPGKYVEYKCKNNLWDVVTPLYIGDKHVANIYTGQFFYSDENVDERFFIDQAKKYGFNLEQYLAALHRVPRFTRPQVTCLMDFLVGFSELISKLSIGNLKLAKAMIEQSRYAEALRQSESNTQQIIEKSPLSIVLEDLNGNVVYLNERFIQTFGYTLDDIPTLEQWWQRAYPDITYRQEVSAIWRKTRDMADQDGKDIEPRDYRVTCKDGMVRQVKIFGTRIGDKNLVILDDVTERRRVDETLQKSRLMLLDVIENFPGVVFWKDCHSVYLGCNKAFAHAAGLHEPDEIIGKTDDDLPWARFEAATYQADDQEVMISGHPKLGIIETQNQAEGRVAWFETNKVPLVDGSGKVIGILGTSNDITARKMAEDQLIQESRRKDEFLAMLSHELRNPLAPIRNAIEVMRLAGRNEEIFNRQRTIIERQVKQLSRLLDDLLDVACITRGRIGIKKERIALSNVIDQALETTMILSGERRADFSCLITEKNIMLDGDLPRLVQVVCNLLGNAMKYSEPGQPVSLSVFTEPSSDPTHPREAVICVEDSGIGIDPDLLPKIFDLFVQADKTLDRSRGGLGLGLTLTRRIVELHGGRIHASSPGLGQGSQFKVWLPVEIEQEPSPPRTQSK